MLGLHLTGVPVLVHNVMYSDSTSLSSNQSPAVCSIRRPVYFTTCHAGATPNHS